MILIYKLVDGEYLIGTLIETAEKDKVTLKNPLTVIVTAQGPAFVPVMDFLSDDNEVTFGKESVIYTIAPAKEVYEAYEKHTSPIVQPSKQLII